MRFLVSLLNTNTAIRVFIEQTPKNRAIPFSIEVKSEQEAFHSPKNVAILKARYERAQKGQGLIQKGIIDKKAFDN